MTIANLATSMNIPVKNIVLTIALAVAAASAYIVGQNTGREQSQFERLSDRVHGLESCETDTLRRLSELEDWRKRFSGRGQAGAAP